MKTVTNHDASLQETQVLDRQTKNVIAFFDGYNFLKSQNGTLGNMRNDIDLFALAKRVCDRHEGWSLRSTRFYMGIPTYQQSPHQHARCLQRLGQLKSRNVKVITRSLRARNGVLREKGIDTRICIDVIRMAFERQFNVALLFSQDQDFAELAREIQSLRTTGLPVEMVCAFPDASHSENRAGINGARWERVQIDDLWACDRAPVANRLTGRGIGILS